LEEELKTAYINGRLLKLISEYSLKDRNTDDIIKCLIVLNNRGDVDVIQAFKELKSEPELAYKFFTVRQLLEKILPEVNNPVEDVMECVLNALNEAGADWAAGTILPPFVNYCSKESTRPTEGLELIERQPNKFGDLLPQVIMAGARIDISLYVSHAIRLANHQSVEVRSRAIYSIGVIEKFNYISALEQAVSCLENTANNETDDRVLASAIMSIVRLGKLGTALVERKVPVIYTALSKGGDFTLHAGATILAQETLSDAEQDTILLHLQRVAPQNEGTLRQIDHAIVNMLQRGQSEKSRILLENLLLKNPQSLSLQESLQSASHELRAQRNILNTLATIWFMTGNKILCENIAGVISEDNEIAMSVDSSVIDPSDSEAIYFIARKSIGFLFSYPIAAVSYVVSLLEFVSDDDFLEVITELLFNPLLLSYPGKITNYLQNVQSSNEKTKKAIQYALKRHESYMESIRIANGVVELLPYQEHIYLHNRKMMRLMSQAMMDAREKSAIMSLVSTSVILHGTKSIDYVKGADDSRRRIEISLSSHSTELELPRLTFIDPVGLDYMLRVFRSEQFAQ